MKILLILLTFVLTICCTRSTSIKTDNSLQPVVEVSSVSNQIAENNSFSANESIQINREKISAFPTPEKISMEEFWRKENKNRVSKFGLYDLERRRIAEEDIEVRVWQITDFYMGIYKDLGVKESVFILKRTNGNWSAKVLRNTINQKSGVEKQIKTNLDAPKSGWKSVWQKFIDNELLTFPDSISKKSIPDADASICIIESKVDGIFKTYENVGNSEIKEIRHTAKILNIIADEFNLEDFQSTKKYEE